MGGAQGACSSRLGSLTCINIKCLIGGVRRGGGHRGSAAVNLGKNIHVLGFGGSEALQLGHEGQRMCTATKVPDAKMLLGTQL